MKHIKGLDTLRAFAVYFVIIAHWGPYFNNINDFGRFIQIFLIPDGATAVYVFFVLSGFLITSILLDERSDEKISSRFLSLKNFFIRRSLRIFPIYYLLLFFLYWINYPDVRHYFKYFVTYTSNILCYRTNSWNSIAHTWTLSIEEQFYFIWPWFILFINKKYLKYVFVSAIIIGLCTTYAVYNVHNSMEPFLVFNCFDAFGIGGFFAYARQNEARGKNFEGIINAMAPVAIILYFYWKIAFYFYQPQYGYFLQKTIHSVIAIWLIIGVFNNKSERVRKYLLENRFLNFIGKISYGIYLYHIPFIPLIGLPIKNFMDKYICRIHIFNDMWVNYLFYYFIDLILLVVVCWLSYRFIEKPLLALKRFFKYSKPKAPDI